MAELKMDFTKMAESFAKNAKNKGMFVGWWVPVSERLPEEYGEYLISWIPTNLNMRSGLHGRCLIEICEYEPDIDVTKPGEWLTESIYQAEPCGIEVIAWMPLPDPYKADKEGD